MVWTYRELEKLILEGGEEAFDELHEKKRQLLREHIKVLSEHVEQLEKKRKKLMKLKKEIEDELKRLNDDLGYIDSLLHNPQHRELRVTEIDDLLLDKAILKIKKAEKATKNAAAALGHLAMHRPHYVIHMYYETWTPGAREILKKNDKYAKRTLDAFITTKL
ncbi:MAG: hypothetical protein H0Z28_13925 [Archaeoglobus sp.]|nr:hypothetical protein [Archaeoglobus sp.]